MTERTLLVTSSRERRMTWSALLRDDRSRVIQCTGPTASCPLLRGAPCPLHAEAEAIVYDQDVVTPDFLVALLAAPPSAPVFFATANGLHPPRMTHVLSGGMVRATAAGAA